MKKKLWSENAKLLSAIETFETKGDIVLDQKLIPYDIQGSLAHVKMLKKIGILSTSELVQLEKGFGEISELLVQNKFVLTMGDEDMHTKIENYLIKHYGNVGKKIHTGRSRNDQVLVALRLYAKDELEKIIKGVQNFIEIFKKFQNEFSLLPMPGYTHMQKAMPSSFGLWSGSFIASLTDDMKILNDACNLINQSPLGSAAGYGVSLPLDRAYTAKLLHFNKVQENAIYCQQSRGKFEAHVLAGLLQVLLTINKFASDVMLFTTQEFAFFKVDEEITTGSSIMPQKRNIDIAELLRSKAHVVLGNYTQIVSLSSNLISGYNRDIQDTKKPFIESLEITLESLHAACVFVENIQPNTKKVSHAMTKDLYATDDALALVLKGENFRDAYKKIKNQYLKGGERNEK